MSTCEVCCEELNNSNRKACICPKCNFSACKTCIRTYLGSSPIESHCMSCKVEWNDTFVLNSVNKTYFHKELREQKKQKCFEIEKSKLAESQIEAKHYLIKEEGKKKIEVINKKLKELKQQMEQLKHDRYVVEIEMNKKIKKEEKAFIMRCQASGCNGFVNKSYKCELCEKTTCSKCLEISEENHECKPEKIESAKVIKEGSRPCPKCAVRISKTDGCNQMWCTNCQTPFDWVSGLELKNVQVHNPHYFQFLQTGNGGVMPRNPHDILCGGMPDLSKFRAYCSLVLHDKDLNRFISTNVYNIYRFIGHIQHVMRNDITRQFETNIEHARIKYILNQTDEATFKEQVYKAYVTRNKRTVNNRLIDTVNVVGVDIIQRYFKSYESTSINGSNITPNQCYEITYKMMQEYCGIIEYFNGLQEEKTQHFKEVGIRITITNITSTELNKHEIMPFNEKCHPLLNYHLMGNP